MLAGLYMAGLFALSSVPDDTCEPGIAEYFPRPKVQNALHVPVYAGLSFLMWRGLRGQRHAALLSAALATAYGVTDEIHQMFVVGRTASLTDALANALGAFAVAGWASLRKPTAPGAPPP
jgi:VanZ family protein